MAIIQFEQTPIWRDVKYVIESGSKPVKHEIRGMLHTVKEDIPILKIVTYDTVRDYINHIGDHIHIEFQFALGDYVTRLYPYRNHLELTIKQITLQETSGIKDPNETIQLFRYKAVFIADQNPNLSGSEIEMYDAESLNKTSFVLVKLQLLDRSLETIRIKTANGIYHQTTQKQLIFNILAGESNKILIDGKPSIDGLDMVTPDNQEIRQHIIIPNGTRIVSIPSYLQEKMGGVYNTDIGTYLQTYKQKKLWFVYPLYNVKRFKEDVDKLIIYVVPQEKFPGLDRTYVQSGKTLHIVATSGKKYQDSGEVDYMNYGVGYRFQEARSFMKKPIEMTEAGPVGQRSSLNHEVILYEREDGLNYAPSRTNGACNNPFYEASKVLARNIARIDFIWENSNPALLYPGMPCKYVFLIQGRLQELEGVVGFNHHYTQLQGNVASSNLYKTVSHITVLVEKSVLKPILSTIESFGVF